MKGVKILKKEVGKNPEIVRIDNYLESFQKIVNGLIEILYLDCKILLVINEEGKLNGSLPNFNLGNDVVMGDCFFVSDNKSGTNFIDITDKQIQIIMSSIDFSKNNNKPILGFEFISWDE